MGRPIGQVHSSVQTLGKPRYQKDYQFGWKDPYLSVFFEDGFFFKLNGSQLHGC